MFNPLVVIIFMLAYFGLLYFLALWVEGRSELSLKIAGSPVVYALSLAVFATSWTYYGSVGKTVTSGMIFSTVYIGPTLAIILWWQIMRRMVRIKDKYHVTSIADFISARYDRSTSLAALASCAALIGTTPYIALQIKSVVATFNTIAGDPGPTTSWVRDQVGILAVLLMTGFTIAIGVRKLDPTERHQGMVTVVALESVIKLAAFLSCGIFITYMVYDGFADIFTKAERLGPQLDTILSLAGSEKSPYSTWATYLVLSMSAIIFLPRQFHMAVIENSNEKHIGTAMWLLPLYLLLISVFVIPIALEGLLSGFPAASADTFVLLLPMRHDNPWLAMFVYIGGVSAAMSMVMISSMTLSTMLTNHILLPIIRAVPSLSFLRLHLLRLRWLGVALVIAVGYWFEATVGDAFMLVNMGMIAFAAALQFAPCILGGLFWEKANKTGARLGLAAGIATWLYTLVVPAFAQSGWAFESLTAHGPFGLELLKPEALFGMASMDPLGQSVFWSMLANISLFVLGSRLSATSESDAALAKAFVNALDSKTGLVGSTHEANIDLSSKTRAIVGTLAKYMNASEAEAIYKGCVLRTGLSDKETVTLSDLADLLGEVENVLAGTVGAAEAHAAIQTAEIYTDRERERLSAMYAEILADLKLTPGELKRRIDYHRERESLLSIQAEALEDRVQKRTMELEEANAELEAFANILTLGLRGPLKDINRFGQAVAKHALALGGETGENLEKLRQASRDMDARIDDILVLARLGRMKVARETVDLGEMLLDAVMVIREGAPDTRVEIEIGPDLKTKADPRLAMLLIANLVGNAWKFCAGSESPKITFGKEELNGKTWFVMRDNGAGFDVREADRLFQPFSRLHGRDEFKGSGIGLTIVDRIIRKHNGEIHAEGEVGKGATFRFTL